MKKKAVLSAVGASTVLALALAGCGSGGAGSTSGDKPETLQMWLPPTMADRGASDETEWGEILAPWEEENGVDVEVTIVSWASYEAKLLTGISSGTGPDVTYMYNEMAGDYVKRNQLLPLDEFITDEDQENFLYLDKGKIDDVQYMLPYIVGGARVMFYNAEVLEKAGVATPPATWEEFTAALTKIKAAGFTPFLQQWGDPNRSMMNTMFYPFLWQAGGDLFNEDGTATAFNSEAGVKAAEFLYSLKTDGLVPDTVTGLNEAQVREQFTSGQVGFVMDSDVQLPQFRDAGVDVGVIDSLEDEEQGTFLAIDSLVALKDCDDPELCMSLLRHILSGDVMSKIHEFAPFNPVAQDEDYAGQPEFAELYQSPEILHNLPVASNSVQAYNLLYENLQQMMLGQKTPEQALSDAATAGDELLKDN